MPSLHSLTQSAMLGTSDEAFLASVIVTGIAELGGYVPATFKGERKACGDVIASAAKQAKPQIPEKAAGLLKRLITGEFDELLPEFLRLTAERGFIVPPETMPALLGLGLSKNDLRGLVISVIGERGRWLAAHNPAWGYALGREPLEAWENGVRAERVAALEHIRAREPGKAREWVQAAWEQSSPEDRAAFVATFVVGLSMEDEPFLEACLDDKRKEVRDAARQLLIRLENSRFVKRMWERVKPLVRMRKSKLEVSLPEEPDSASKRDGLGGALLRKKMGKKANILAQMIASVPPMLWCREFGRSPERLLSAALASEWREPVLLGWQLAAIGAADVAWAEAIAALWTTNAEVESILDVELLPALVMLMRVEKVEALVASIEPTRLDDQSRLLSLLKKYRRPWTAKMARLVVRSAQRQSGDFRVTLPRALPDFALWMPPELADEFSSGWAAETEGYWRESINLFLQIMNFRNEIRRSLEEK